jgi:cell fate regulator YaaT (PSP1 superfamily)
LVVYQFMTHAQTENNKCTTCSSPGSDKLNVYDWLSGMHMPTQSRFVEVKFKNTRKDYYLNDSGLSLYPGEVVVVDGIRGFDIGIVSLVGELVPFQMKRKNIKPDHESIKKLLRKPNQEELDRWTSMRNKEYDTMLESRKFAEELRLNMKISDVEYQADGAKVTFFYTADDRVDFRELIKVLADKFKARIEMRQIGARQEAGRLGGIGTCGRELCCSSWLSDFRSVSTSAARYQQLAINPQKLAGQCGKLKCCLNFELDAYLDALKGFPSTDKKLKAKNGTFYFQKADIFRNRLWYSKSGDPKLICLSSEKVMEIIEMNSKGNFPETLDSYSEVPENHGSRDRYSEVVGQDSLTRFDKNSNRKKKRKKRNRRKDNNS